MISFPTNTLLLVKYLLLTRREQKQCYQLRASILVSVHVITWSWRDHWGSSCSLSSPSPYSESASTDTPGCNHLPSHRASPPIQPREKIPAGSGQVLPSLFLLTGFVLESILRAMGRKIELDLFKGFANEFIHERLQGLSSPSNTSTGFVNQYSPMTFTRKAKMLLSSCFSTFLHILAMYCP